MPRSTALFALSFVVVLFSASSVTSQDPFRARSEAESSERATPIRVIDQLPQPAQSGFRYEFGDETVHVSPSVREPEQLDSQPSTSNVPGAIVDDALPAVEPVEVKQHLRPAVLSPLSHQTSGQSNGTGEIVQPKPTVLTESAGAPLSNLAQRRFFETVPDDVEGHFDLFMYVSKAKRGPLAQKMFVFQRDADGKIIPYAEWPVSTGREKIEIRNEKSVRTHTPEGIFELDPDRFYAKYWSRSWDNAPMHYAMFYDLQNNGTQSGLAIHAAIGASKIRKLGKRDSAGCIRLSPKNAKELFFKIQNTMRGQVPVLATNERGSTDRWGRAARDEISGAIKLQDGYKAVLFVENYDGREEVVGPVVAYLN